MSMDIQEGIPVPPRRKAKRQKQHEDDVEHKLKRKKVKRFRAAGLDEVDVYWKKGW